MNKEKIKQTIQKTLAYTAITTLSLAGLIQAWKIAESRMEKWHTDFFVMKTDDFVIKAPKAKEVIEEKNLSMEEWVLKRFKENGINPDVANCVIQQESQWQDQRLPSKTNDYGLMQWNKQHIESGLLDMSCSYSFKCAVDKAIEKIKKDNGWGAWYGYKDANCGRFGKTFIN